MVIVKTSNAYMNTYNSASKRMLANLTDFKEITDWNLISLKCVFVSKSLWFNWMDEWIYLVHGWSCVVLLLLLAKSESRNTWRKVYFLTLQHIDITTCIALYDNTSELLSRYSKQQNTVLYSQALQVGDKKKLRKESLGRNTDSRLPSESQSRST